MAIDTGSHWLRPLRVWLGEVVEVVAALGYPQPDMEGESLCRALLRFECGVVASFDAMLTTGAIAPQPLFTVTGSRGELTVEGSGWVKLYDGADWKGTKVGDSGGYLQLLRRRAGPTSRRAVLDGTAPAVPAPSTRSASCGVRSRCTDRRRRRRWEPVWA